MEITPSMPLAPRFDRIVMARSVDGSQPSMSRTGIEFPAHRVAPSGSAAASTGNGAPSNGSSSAPSHESIASAAFRSASSQPCAQPVFRVSADALVASRVATARAVSAGSAWTNVAGRSVDSRQPASPSMTMSSGPVRASSSAIGFEVGIAPVRMTSAGRWASIQAP